MSELAEVRRRRRAARAMSLPDPGDNPAERLEHTLAAYQGAPDDQHVLTATWGIYGEHVWTGLTMGDLRAIRTRLGVAELTSRPWCWEHACEVEVCAATHNARKIARMTGKDV